MTFVAEIVSGGVLGPDNLAASLALAMRMGAAVNALLIVRLRIPAIVATLASGYILNSFIVAIQHRSFGLVGARSRRCCACVSPKSPAR